MQKEKIKLSFGGAESVPEGPAPDEAQDAGIMEKIKAVKQALIAGDEKAAMSLIDECLGEQSQDMGSTDEGNGFASDLKKILR